MRAAEDAEDDDDDDDEEEEDKDREDEVDDRAGAWFECAADTRTGGGSCAVNAEICVEFNGVPCKSRRSDASGGG